MIFTLWSYYALTVRSTHTNKTSDKHNVGILSFEARKQQKVFRWKYENFHPLKKLWLT